MKNMLLGLAFLFVPCFASAQIKLEKRSFLNGKMEILVPADFKQMAEDMIAVKYPNRAQQPNAILTNERGTINLVVMYLTQHITPAQISEFKEFQVKLLKDRRPDAVWLDNGVKTVNGKSVGYFTFMISAVDQKVYNYYFFTELDGRILLCTFNCTEKLLPAWKETAETIVNSLTTKT